ncbi:MAG: hypothetical protein U0905_19900 [Pirellulales bacterium]
MRVPFVLSILVVAMLSTHSIAQEKLVILAAHYGDLPDGKKFDVTKKVADLVKENSLRLEASNDLFGDPAEQVGKKLSVRFKLGDQESETQVTEGETLLVPIPKLVGELVIHKAIYGDLPDGPTYDVTDIVKGYLRNNQLEIAVENDLLGDPASGTFKRLRVEYSIGKVQLAKSVYEGGRMKIVVPQEKKDATADKSPAKK